MPQQESPSRAIQQELIFQNIPAKVRSLVRQLTPTDRPILSATYGSTITTTADTIEKTGAIIQASGLDTFHYIFGIATTAQNSIQLFNTVCLLTCITEWSRYRSNFDLEKTAKNFLNTLTTPPPTTISEEAASLNERMIQIHNKHNKNLQTIFAPITSTIATEIKDTLFNPRDKTLAENAPYCMEAYISTILNPDAPMPLRVLLLTKAEIIFADAGMSIKTMKIDPRFAENTSIWQVMDGSWFYPELFSRENQPSEKDLLMSRLRAQIADLKQTTADQAKIRGLQDAEIQHLTEQLRETHDKLELAKNQPNQKQGAEPEPRTSAQIRQLRLEKEELQQKAQILATEVIHLRTRNAKLEDVVSRFSPLFNDVEQRLNIFKEIGGHPLDVLGISQRVWKSATVDQRRELLKQRYKEEAKKHHYQVPKTDPQYNDELAAYKNAEFNRATRAKKFLEERLDIEEF